MQLVLCSMKVYRGTEAGKEIDAPPEDIIS